MLPVIICEDNDIQRDKKNIIEVKKVIDFVDSQSSILGVYFFDIELKNCINGLKLAEYVRKKDPEGYITFITSHSEMSFLTFKYKVEALDFILKDNPKEIKSHLELCLKYIHQANFSKGSSEKALVLKHNDIVYRINTPNIFFIETSNSPHKIVIHEEKRHLEVYGNLKDIQETLDNGFYRCHRAFLVNRRKIKEIDLKKREIHMANGEKCLASFRYIGGLTK